MLLAPSAFADSPFAEAHVELYSLIDSHACSVIDGEALDFAATHTLLENELIKLSLSHQNDVTAMQEIASLKISLENTAELFELREYLILESNTIPSRHKLMSTYFDLHNRLK